MAVGESLSATPDEISDFHYNASGRIDSIVQIIYNGLGHVERKQTDSIGYSDGLPVRLVTRRAMGDGTLIGHTVAPIHTT